MSSSGKRPLKVEFHLHSSADPVDDLPLDLAGIIEQAAACGYDVVCATHHEAVVRMDGRAREVSARTGVLVIPGIEATLEGDAHVLVINCGPEAAELRTLQDLERYRRPEHLVVAAHPYYPRGLGRSGLLDAAAPLLDAVEWCHFWHPRLLGPNLAAVRSARHLGLPLVGSGDVHLPGQLGHTWSLVEARKEPRDVVEAVRAGRVEVVTRSLRVPAMAGMLARLLLRNTVLNRHRHRRLAARLGLVERSAAAGRSGSAGPGLPSHGRADC